MEAQKSGKIKLDRRARAIELIARKGYSQRKAAEVCEMDQSQICFWVNRYQQEGINGLRNKPIPGAKPRLMHDQKLRITFSKNAKKRASFFSWKNLTDCIEKVYLGEKADLYGMVKV